MSLNLLAAVLAIALTAQPTNATGPATESPGQPPPEVELPRRPPMEFRVVEGRGFFGLTRWIQASGAIYPDTAERFQAFLRENRVEGMTVVFDSPGGEAYAGFALGRAIRAAGLSTTIGRTVERWDGDRREVVLLSVASCDSACAFAFLGGAIRVIPDGALLGVHQARAYRAIDGRQFPVGPGDVEAYQLLQRISAEAAVYVQEMGVDLRFLVAAANVSFHSIHYLEEDELWRLRVALQAPIGEMRHLPVRWSRDPSAGNPMLFRRAMVVDRPDLAVRQELSLECDHRDPNRVRLIMVLSATRAENDEAISLQTLTVALGEHQVIWRSPHSETRRASSRFAFVAVALPSDAVVDAARAGRLAIELPQDARPNGRLDIASEDLAPLVEPFTASCHARHHLRTTSVN